MRTNTVIERHGQAGRLVAFLSVIAVSMTCLTELVTRPELGSSALAIRSTRS